jgi:hypothetical protein
MVLVRGDIIRQVHSVSMETSPAHDGFLVFRRNDTRKRINITTERYRLNDQKWLQILHATSPLGARKLRNMEAEIDDDGDIVNLTFEPENVEYFGNKLSVPGAKIDFEKPNFREPPADLIAYRQCMEEIILHRTFVSRLVSLATSEKASEVANCEIEISLFDLSGREVLESIAVHYRKIFELMIYACWTAFEPRMDISYETKQIKNIYQSLRKNFPDVHTFMVPVFANSFEPIPAEKREGFDFDELMQAYGFCGKIVHENGPYRPPFDVKSALEKFVEWNSRLLTVLALHRIQISPSDFVFCRCRGDNKVFAWIDSKKPQKIPKGALDATTSEPS